MTNTQFHGSQAKTARRAKRKARRVQNERRALRQLVRARRVFANLETLRRHSDSRHYQAPGAMIVPPAGAPFNVRELPAPDAAPAQVFENSTARTAINPPGWAFPKNPDAPDSGLIPVAIGAGTPALESFGEAAQVTHEAVRAMGAEPPAGLVSPPVFACNANGCGREFDSVRALAAHKGRAHRGGDAVPVVKVGGRKRTVATRED